MEQDSTKAPCSFVCDVKFMFLFYISMAWLAKLGNSSGCFDSCSRTSASAGDPHGGRLNEGVMLLCLSLNPKTLYKNSLVDVPRKQL